MISDSLATFLESGLSFTVASRDGALRVSASRAWAIRVDEDRSAVTLFLYGPASGAVLRNLESWPELAVCVDRPADNRACQMKGRFEGSRPALPGERDEVERQSSAFLENLERIGIPRTMTSGWANWPCVAIRMRVSELYEQTPGPGAGERLTPGSLPAGTPQQDGRA